MCVLNQVDFEITSKTRCWSQGAPADLDLLLSHFPFIKRSSRLYDPEDGSGLHLRPKDEAAIEQGREGTYIPLTEVLLRCSGKKNKI